MSFRDFILKRLGVWGKDEKGGNYILSQWGNAPERDTKGCLQSYGQVYSLFGIVQRIASAVSEVKWRLYKGNERSERSQIGEHPILDLLDKVNEFQTGQELIELHSIYSDLSGKVFWYLPRNKLNIPGEIWILPSHQVKIIPSKEKFISGYIYQAGNEQIPFDLGEIIWFSMPDPLNPLGSVGFAQAASVEIASEDFSGRWNRNFFYNSARADAVIETENTLSDDDFQKLKSQWNVEHRGLGSAHKIAILQGGLKYKQTQIMPKDMDFYQLRKRTQENLLFTFGMPLSVMGVSENVNKANAEAGDYTFARWLIKPRLTRIKNKLNEQLLPMFNAKGLELDFDEVVPETVEQKKGLAESGLRSGALTINEGRKLYGFDPLPPEQGDVLLIPLNMIATPIGSIGKSVKKGGEGSGNFGHEGRPGEVGGSGEGGGGGATGSDWHDSLSSEERGAVEGWSGSAGKIREYQRDGKGDAKTKKQTENLEDALNKDGNYEGKAYRGISNIDDAQYNEILNSDTIELKALSSASMDKKVAFGFAKGKNNVVFEIDAKSGVDISGISEMPWEKEVVLRKGAKYKVGKSRTEKLGNYTFTVLKMKEL